MEALIVAAGFTGSFVFSVFITYQLLQTGDQRRRNRAVSDVSAMDLLRGGDMLVGKERKGQGQQRTVSILSRFCRTCHRWYDQ